MNTEGLAKRVRDPKDDVGEDPYSSNDKVPKVSRKQGMRGIRSLLIAVVLPFAAGSIVALRNSPDEWYNSLKKPFWNPPNWLFGLVWSLLYPVMGLASWLVWAKGGRQRSMCPLTLYVLQLGLNLLWSPLFFGWHSPLLAFVDVSALAAVLLMCIFAFKALNPVASHLMKPYLAWVLLAAALNLSILVKNMGSQETAVTEFEQQ
ncbi:hypothetical protein O6H91_09G050400 [Diphasiastrum complanatum]|uniref:Uncharacterized protein n=1 Tax=Diphasiastrum complanatum TaxID=34168 RepID=A0ACC2CP77_DIPCM|nr:hypothetical protein O6H91_09G050400 [Diphasiastrum complanatum]